MKINTKTSPIPLKPQKRENIEKIQLPAIAINNNCQIEQRKPDLVFHYSYDPKR